MSQDSIFTKIIKGELPSYKIYEDDRTVAFLDIYPAVAGQTVVVPKAQVEFVWDLEGNDYQALMNASKKVARHLRQKLGTHYVGSKIEGVDVPHAHVKLYPFDTVAEYNARQDMSAEPDHGKLKVMHEKLTMMES